MADRIQHYATKALNLESRGAIRTGVAAGAALVALSAASAALSALRERSARS